MWVRGSLGRPRKIWALCGLTAAFCLAGCQGSAPVRVDLAQKTLKQVMEKWQSGATPDSLQAESPKIVVQDLDWSGGAELLAFEVLGEGEPMNANLIARVKLKLRTKEGAETEKTATYVVGTSPVLTVFRDMMR